MPIAKRPRNTTPTVRFTLPLLLFIPLACGPGVLDPGTLDPGIESLDDCRDFHDTTRGISSGYCPEGGRYAPLGPGFGPTIEGYAKYVGQTTCDNREKPGVSAFREFVNQTYPCTGDYGISRACSAGGRSEHKEGRAWDWRVNASHPSAQALVDWLLATDEHGNRHAMARRMGLMYMVWNRKIWRAYRAEEGWQRYAGSNPHTDHIHFSFSWAGARKTSTFWAGVRPDHDGDYGSCFYGGARGVCQEDTKACSGSYRGSICPGPASVRCCMPEPAQTQQDPPDDPPAWGGCADHGLQGQCQDIGQACDGAFKAGLCPGPSRVRCCLPKPDWGSCGSGGQRGQCQDIAQTCNGSYRSGLCPGPSAIRCCLP